MDATSASHGCDALSSLFFAAELSLIYVHLPQSYGRVMRSLRFSALQAASSRKTKRTRLSRAKVSDYFGSHALGLAQMRHLLPSEAYDRLRSLIAQGQPLDLQTADVVAAAVRNWAIERGATHYTHWFHPLTGATAEKHDAFFDSTQNVELLKSNALVQQEPDASSFPSGGIRSTFEARGYTAWDPSSPFFIWDTTLCIPTIFVSYTGDALDYKAPLLKSIQEISSAATKLCRYFDPQIEWVRAVVGWEQEFFVVDRALYQARPDLMMCGRTLFGRPPAKGQQLADHYFGSITPRVLEYLKALEVAAYRLGIPLCTRHNEVAPSQYEVAPMFEEAQIAADHNQLLKDVMEKIAREHDLQVLFHEKPFAHLNGNGKHCNWSLLTNQGTNLMQPQYQNPLFLIFFLLTLRGIYRNASLLRASISSYANDYRLGAHEAPPAIISVFVGEQFQQILRELTHNKPLQDHFKEKSMLSLGIHQIAQIPQDNTDRNRTSPIAFTGNKFEFRSVGAEANISHAMTTLNTLLADEAVTLCQKLEQMPTKHADRQAFLAPILSEYAKEVQPILFNGNGYSSEWVEEANKRGLPHLKTTPEALRIYTTKDAENLFSRHQIFTPKELESRYQTELEKYIKKIDIEIHLSQDLISNHIIPTSIQYQNTLLQNLRSLKEAGIQKTPLNQILHQLHDLISTLIEESNAMEEALHKIRAISDPQTQAEAYADRIAMYYFPSLRSAVDALELIVDDELWPLVKYRELLFFK